MISLIQGQVVSVHGWLSEAAFTDIVGISQSTPGPIAINCATYVGYEVIRTAGGSAFLASLGSAVATIAVVLPSFIIFGAIVRLFEKFHKSPVFTDIMKALKPTLAALIGAAAVVLTVRISFVDGALDAGIIRENFPDWKAWLLFAAAFLLSYTKKVGPIAIIIASGITGLLIY